MRKLLFLVFISFIGISCKTSQNLSRKNPIAKMIDTSAVFANSFTGLAIYDTQTQRNIFERNADKYFTPASNTKLFTYYACLKTLKDSIPALKYKISGDSLLFWGTSDPTFLHPDFQNTKALDFLKTYKRSKKFYFSDQNFTNDALGSGWAWNDYNDYYSAEISPLPMYGNFVRVNIKDEKLNINPSIFENSFYKKDEAGSYIKRTVHDSQFLLPKSLLKSKDYSQDIPYKTSAGLTQQLLIDTLRKNINLTSIPVAADAKTLYSIPSDTLYKYMLQPSDNMFAEHLLLLCGMALKDSLNTSFAIKHTIQNYLQDLPDAPKWADGSGLSRYNLFTPRSIVALLQKIQAEVPQERLFASLPIGGKAGTIRNMFKTEEKPFVFAKTGSLSGVYNLSGYLITKSGKTLIFSFMNNNFNKPTSTIRKEVEKVITWIHLNM